MSAAKGPNNVDVNSRLKQILVLAVLILVGMIVSQATQAQDFHKAKAKHFKSKYKTQIKMNSSVCALLEKRRTQVPSKPIFAFLKSKPKYKPQAEVDAPSYVRVKNKPDYTAKAETGGSSLAAGN
jgi:hypothetical protein